MHTKPENDVADEVESPCTGVCKLDPGGSYCIGCLRTPFEIGVWSRASNDEKRAILARLAGL
ncbi:DUF1289 domain-containing protein [Kordiimonas aestuarii]|uniref:DUF1289 domain-containing protein n=1 Tax=Kordiimonas aestuarii TaxID=1005925 RepID=UPI0021CF56B2|nr:DUF1289 domain-containing protein [Kordiimonas aestuarii]